MQGNEKKVSIIVPAYNVEKYVEKCLDSLVNQTYKNIEIIIVNDGSKDETLSIVEKYSKEDKRVIVINQQNQGLSESRNNAMEIATGDYLMFVDSDDWVDTNMCEVCVNEMESENADLILFSYIREYDNKSILKSQFNQEKIVFENEQVKIRLQRRIFGPYENDELAHPEKLDSLSTAWGKLYKKDIISNCKFKSFKEIGATCEDVFFNIDVLDNVNKAVFIDKHMYHYRKSNMNALTKSAEKDMYEKWKKAYLCLNDILANRNYGNDYLESLNNRFAINIIAIGQRIVNSSDSSKVKRQYLKDILNDDVYINSIKSLNTSSMPIYWRTYFYCAKRKLHISFYCLVKIICILASKI